MPKKLTRLRIYEGSLVDHPANQHAKVVLWKRHDQDERSADPVTIEDEDMTTKRDDDARAELELEVAALTKANADLTAKLDAQEKAVATAETAKLTAQIAELTAKLADAEARAAKGAESKAQPDESALTKGLSFEQKEAFEALRKQTAANAETIAKMRDEAEERDAISKVEKTWPSLPVKAKDFGPVYRKIAKALEGDDDGMAMLAKVLTSYGQMAQIAESTVGRAAIHGSGDAWAEIETKAGEIRKSDPTMTGPKSIELALKREPELYRRYQQEQTAQ